MINLKKFWRSLGGIERQGSYKASTAEIHHDVDGNTNIQNSEEDDLEVNVLAIKGIGKQKGRVETKSSSKWKEQRLSTHKLNKLNEELRSYQNERQKSDPTTPLPQKDKEADTDFDVDVNTNNGDDAADDGDDVDDVDMKGNMGDPDYIPENNSDLKFKPSSQQIDKELKLLQENDSIIEQKVLSDYLQSNDNNSSGEESKDQEEQNSKLQKHPDFVIQESRNDIATENNDVARKLKSTEKRTRRQRVSQYYLTTADKNKLLEKIHDKMQITLEAKDLLGLSPEFRSYINKRTKAILVDPLKLNNRLESNLVLTEETEGTEQENLLELASFDICEEGQDDNESETDDESEYKLESFNASLTREDEEISKPLIKFKVQIKSKELTALYDPGSMANLISRNVVEELKLKTQPFSAVISGINPGQGKIKDLVKTWIKIGCHELPITLLVHDSLPSDRLIIGMAFKDKTHFEVVYADAKSDEKNIQFTYNQVPITYKLLDENLGILESYNSEVIDIDEKLKSILDKSIFDDEEKAYFMEKVQEVKEVFQLHENDIGKFKGDGFEPIKIPIGEHKPWMLKGYPVGSKRAEMIDLLRTMLKTDQIEFAENSKYRNPVFCIRKSNGSLRLLLDLRILNEYIPLEANIPPNIHDIISNLAEGEIFSKFDISNAYYQLEILESSRDLTTFNSPIGCLRMKRLPQGFRNLVSIFSGIMNKMLQPMAKEVFSFLDDICIPGNKRKKLDPNANFEHIDKIIRLFTILKDHGLKLNANKIEIGKSSTSFLGFQVSEQGVRPLKSRLQALEELPPPTDIKQLDRIIGVSNYYRSFLPGLSEILKPLYQLLNKCRKEGIKTIKLTDEELLNFNFLKKSLLHGPHISSMKNDRKLQLYTDASISTWACVLQQEDKEGNKYLIDCISGGFKNAELRYTIYEKEIFSIYLGLTHLQYHFLDYPGKIEVFCDNQSAVKLINGRLDNQHQVNRLWRWLNTIRNFDIELKHIPTDLNILADTFTRVHNPNKSILLSEDFYQAIDDFRLKLEIQVNISEITNDCFKYKNYSLNAIKHYLQHLQVPEEYQTSKKIRQQFIYRAMEFYIADGKLYKLGSKGQFSRLVVMNDTELFKIFEVAHDQGGHMKIHTLFDKLNLQFYIPNLYQKLLAYISSCETCQKYDSPTKTRDSLRITRPGGLFQTVICDSVHIGDYYLVIARDEFSFWAEATVLDSLEAEKIADFLYKDILCRYGMVSRFKSDNGSEFNNKIIDRLLNYHNVEHAKSIQFHPMGNAISERGHVAIISFLKKLPKELDWRKYLPTALKTDRNTVKSTTGFTPQYLLYGYMGYTSLDLLCEKIPDDKLYTQEELFKFRFQQLQFRESQYQSAYISTERNRSRYKQIVDNKNESNKKIEPGDWVLVYDRPLKNPFASHAKKLEEKWAGPYKVASRGDRIYWLEELDGTLMGRPYSREMIKPFISRK